jgi:hypothetical protein
MDTTNCIVWFDAADISTLTLVGSNVTSWASKVGTLSVEPNNDLTNGNTVSPEYIQSSRAVYFDNGATQDGNQHPGVQGLESITPFVFDASSANVTTYIVANMLDGTCTGTGGSTFNSALTMNITASPDIYYAYHLNRLGPSEGRNIISGSVVVSYGSDALPTFQPFVMAHTTEWTTSSSITGSMYVNSVNIANSTAGATKPTLGNQTTNLVIAAGTIAGNRVFTGYIHEILMYNVKHTDAQRQAIENYLIDKWNINEQFQLKTNFILYQYIPIEPIPISAQGVGDVDIFVDTATLPVVNAGTYIVTFYARDDRGTTTFTIQITVILPRIVKQQSGAGAYTSLVRQYTEVNAAQGGRDTRIFPAQQTRLGEFTAPIPSVVTTAQFSSTKCGICGTPECPHYKVEAGQSSTDVCDFIDGNGGPIFDAGDAQSNVCD